MKSKNEFSINVEIVEVHNVKHTKAKSYLTAIRDGNKLIPAGKTYNTNVNASVGDKIKVVFVELSKYIDPKTKELWFDFWTPKVIEKTKTVDSLITANELVSKSGGQIDEKRFPTRYRNLLDEDEYITAFLNKCEGWEKSDREFEEHNFVKKTIDLKQESPVMDLPKEKRPYRFVIQEHQRGRSSHLDFRLEMDNHLIGFTLDDPGKVGVPLRFRNDEEYSSKNKILSQLKNRQPNEWLSIKGLINPGEAGAAKNIPTRFKLLDKGTYELGTQKLHLLEVFLKGSRYKGRFLFEKLPRREELKEKAGKKALAWFVRKPIVQVPYVLSSRAIKLNWVPPKGRSALPSEWEEKIPKELRWWEKNWEGRRATASIESIRQIFLKRNILTLERLKFKLQRLSWEGQKTPEKWWLKFSNGIYYILDANPQVKKEGINAVKKIYAGTKFWNLEKGEVRPEMLGNPNKMVDTNIETLEKGTLDQIESTERFSSFRFFGKKFKGFWTAKSTNESLVFESSQANTKHGLSKNNNLSEWQLGSIYYLSRNNRLSLQDVANNVGCSKESVIYWQKKLGFR